MQDILDQATLDLLSDMCMDGVIVIDRNEVVVYVNDMYCSIFHRERNEILHRKIREFAKESQLPEVMSTNSEMRGRLDSYVDNTSIPDSIDKVFYVTRKPIIRNGEVVGAVGYVKAYSTTNTISKMIKQLNDKILLYRSELLKHGSPIDFSCITSRSEAMRQIKKMAIRVADSDFPVLLLGETGTGKEVFANAIHAASSRKSMPLIKVNCAAIPESLIESELFGYEEGAFSGAKKGGKPGKFELAGEGTIFLDEIGELPLNMQSKLLRVLQEGELERIGGTKTIKVNFRLLAATNQDLPEKIAAGRFRKDLYYRISTVPIKIPPLRERKEDLPDLVQQFLSELNHRYGTKKTIDNLAVQHIMLQPFPGNVRELKNMIGRAFVMSDGDVIVKNDLAFLQAAAGEDLSGDKIAASLNSGQRAERDLLINTLKETNYNCKKTAGILGITRMTLYRKIDKYGIDLNRV